MRVAGPSVAVSLDILALRALWMKAELLQIPLVDPELPQRRNSYGLGGGPSVLGGPIEGDPLRILALSPLVT